MAKITDSDIFKAYQAAEGLSQSDMAEALGITRQGVHNYLKGTRPTTEFVLRWFLHGSTDWVKEMALEIFARRPGHEVPCVCLERIGDNGPCPRHAAVLMEDPVGVEEEL